MQEFIKERADKRIDRVKMLKAPVGEDSTPIVTHRFKYTIYDKDTQDANGKKIEAGAGGDGCLFKKYWYSNDNWNLLTQEWEANGKGIYYAYHPESNAIITKLMVDGSGKIHSREFNTYNDDNLFLTKKIVDDGISNDHDSLDGTTFQQSAAHLWLPGADRAEPATQKPPGAAWWRPPRATGSVSASCCCTRPTPPRRRAICSTAGSPASTTSRPFPSRRSRGAPEQKVGVCITIVILSF